MPQVLEKIYAERDVTDVEAYVRDAVGDAGLLVGFDEREQLVARGILLVRRIARALPPDASLDAVLRDRLATALTAFHGRDVRARATRSAISGLAPRRAA